MKLIKSHVLQAEKVAYEEQLKIWEEECLKAKTAWDSLPIPEDREEKEIVVKVLGPYNDKPRTYKVWEYKLIFKSSGAPIPELGQEIELQTCQTEKVWIEETGNTLVIAGKKPELVLPEKPEEPKVTPMWSEILSIVKEYGFNWNVWDVPEEDKVVKSCKRHRIVSIGDPFEKRIPHPIRKGFEAVGAFYVLDIKVGDRIDVYEEYREIEFAVSKWNYNGTPYVDYGGYGEESMYPHDENFWNQ